MGKLTDEERRHAIYNLEHRLREAIEQTPKGVTALEIRKAILRVKTELLK